MELLIVNFDDLQSGYHSELYDYVTADLVEMFNTNGVEQDEDALYEYLHDSLFEACGFDCNSDKCKINGIEYVFSEFNWDDKKVVIWYGGDWCDGNDVDAFFTSFFTDDTMNVHFTSVDNTWVNYNFHNNIVAYRSRSKYGMSYFYGIYVYVGDTIEQQKLNNLKLELYEQIDKLTDEQMYEFVQKCGYENLPDLAV